MRYFGLLLIYTLTCCLFATARVADRESGHRLLSRAACDYHCGKGIRDCHFTHDVDGRLICKAAPSSAIAHIHLSEVANGAGVQLLP
ncbi:hypothetical protein LZ30DRAFT_707612 [Colletotrichum cereale]|nr:hypothetical protein LZ30DRAFT_707612 [Colletotrichum cereale]